MSDIRLTKNVRLLDSLNINEYHTLLCTFSATRYVEENIIATTIYGFFYISGDAYISFGPTFESADGEYRNRVLPMLHYNKMYNRWQEQISQATEYVIEEINKNRLVINTHYFFPPKATRKEIKAFKELCENERYAIDLYALSWIIYYRQFSDNLAENHISTKYKSVIMATEPEAKQDMKTAHNKVMKLFKGKLYTEMQVLKARDKEHIEKSYSKFYNEFTRYSLEEYDLIVSNLQIGQKIIPLTEGENMDKDNIYFHAWREIYFTQLVSEFTRTGLTPCFPVYHKHFFIYNTNKRLYDGNAIKAKLNANTVYQRYNKELGELAQKAEDEGRNYDGLRNIAAILEYVQTQTENSYLYSKLSLCLIEEHMGRTIYDLPHLIMNSRKKRSYAMEQMFENPDLFAKHIFELIYSLYLMNSRYHMMHCDLHLNNVIWYRLMLITEEEAKKTKPHIQYSVDKYKYEFPHLGTFCAIIDQSRSICVSNVLIDHKLSDQYYYAYIDYQIEDMIDQIKQRTKLTGEQYTKLKRSIEDNKELMLRIISVIDSITLAENFKFLVSEQKVFKRRAIPQKIHDLLDNIILTGSNIFFNGINEVLTDNYDMIDMRFPNLVLLLKCFKEYRVTGVSKNNIIDKFPL